MKSKVSYIKYGIECWKKQIWLFAVSSLLYFLFCTIPGLLGMNSLGAQKIPVSQLRTDFLGFFVKGGAKAETPMIAVFFLLTTLFIGTAAGVGMFVYLHSKTKTDFYHALPVSRQRNYLIRFGIALADFLIPAIIFVNLLLVIASLRGIAGTAAWAAAWRMIGTGMVCFMMAYSVASLAMLLTGRGIVGGLGVWIFVVTGPVMAILQTSWCSTFYRTFDYPKGLMQLPMWRYSPYVYVWNAAYHAGIVPLVISLIIALLLFAAGGMLYRIRPMEAAGKSMAFHWPAVIIQVVLTVIFSLFLGIFFGTILGGLSKVWFVFGIIFGLLTGYVMIQIIYIPDFKKLSEGRWRLLISGLIVLITALVSVFDLTGYDAYLPKQEKIQDIAIVHGWSNNENVIDKITKTRMHLPCDDNIYGYLKDLTAKSQSFEDNDSTPRHTCQIRLHLKNGKEVYRQYDIADHRVRTSLAKLFDYPEYRENLYTLSSRSPEEVIRFEWRKGDASGEIYSDQEQDKTKALARALQDDIRQMNSATVTGEIPVAQIDCTIRPVEDSGEDFDSEIYESILVYPSFNHTLAILEAEGKEIRILPKTEEISKIEVYSLARRDGTTPAKPEQVLENEKEISEVLTKIIPEDLITVWTDVDMEKSIEITKKDGSMISGRYLQK